jgi:hypothetical protein
VEAWYRAGRHREIAEYCLDDVRATKELYEKLAPTLLTFNKDFRDADDRDDRDRAKQAPPAEPTFMDSVMQTSLALMPALEAAPVTERETVAASVVFEKLITPEEQEEEIPLS